MGLGVGASAAYGYFTSSGSGSAAGVTATGDQAVTIATNATPGTLLYPGATGDLVITATNPNSVPVQITGLTLGTISGCTTPAITLTSPSSGYLPFTIPAHASSQRLVIAGALSMGTNASNDCQGVTFTIPLSTVTVHQ
jgi:hypothetical protein